MNRELDRSPDRSINGLFRAAPYKCISEGNAPRNL